MRKKQISLFPCPILFFLHHLGKKKKKKDKGVPAVVHWLRNATAVA